MSLVLADTSNTAVIYIVFVAAFLIALLLAVSERKKRKKAEKALKACQIHLEGAVRAAAIATDLNPDIVYSFVRRGIRPSLDQIADEQERLNANTEYEDA